VQRAVAENRLRALVELAQILPQQKGEIEAWLKVELSARSRAWVEELESAVFNGHNAALLVNLLPRFYEALDMADRADRSERLRQRAIQLLLKDKQFASALAILQALAERQPKLEAVCQEGMGDFRSAAASHLAAGNMKEALSCYRSIPDLEAAVKLVREIGEHPAAASLEWMSRLQQFVAERPEKFTKVVTAAEKKFLEEVLERALGVSRRKPAARKANKPPAPRKRVQRKTRGSEESYF